MKEKVPFNFPLKTTKTHLGVFISLDDFIIGMAAQDPKEFLPIEDFVKSLIEVRKHAATKD